jgi:hypothetical protein
LHRGNAGGELNPGVRCRDRLDYEARHKQRHRKRKDPVKKGLEPVLGQVVFIRSFLSAHLLHPGRITDTVIALIKMGLAGVYLFPAACLTIMMNGTRR